MATDIYTFEFNPTQLSHKEEALGLIYSDNDTACELMKKEEKMIIAELTVNITTNGGYKNITELNGKIYSDNKFKDFVERYRKTLKERNRSKIRYESFKAFRNDLRTKVVNERELVKKNL